MIQQKSSIIRGALKLHQSLHYGYSHDRRESKPVKKTSINLRVKLMSEGNPHLHSFLQTHIAEALDASLTTLLYYPGLFV